MSRSAPGGADLLRPGDELFVAQGISSFHEALSRISGNIDICPRPFFDQDYVNPETYFGAGQSTELAVGLAYDSERLQSIGLAILEDARRKKNQGIDNPVVIDAGTGTGVLSYLTSELFKSEGLSPHIIAIEVEHPTIEVFRSLQNQLGYDAEVIEADARFPMPDIGDIKADTVISENIYTGLLAEPQVAIVRTILASHVNRSDTGSITSNFIPKAVDLSVYFGQTAAPVGYRESWGRRSIQVNEVSAPVLYKSVDFARLGDEVEDLFDGVSSEVALRSVGGGLINLVGLRMLTRFGESSATWLMPNRAQSLGNDQLIMISPDAASDSTGLHHLQLDYAYGAKTDDISIGIT